MNAADFSDARIDAVRSGEALTPDERSFLISDTARMEECTHTEQELAAMTDTELMEVAYSAWVDYTRSMGMF